MANLEIETRTIVIQEPEEAIDENGFFDPHALLQEACPGAKVEQIYLTPNGRAMFDILNRYTRATLGNSTLDYDLYLSYYLAGERKYYEQWIEMYPGLVNVCGNYLERIREELKQIGLTHPLSKQRVIQDFRNIPYSRNECHP